MLKNQRWQGLGNLLVMPMLALTAFAKEPAIPAGRTGGFQARMEKAVGLTPEQREAVSGLLSQQREDLKALRESHTPQYAAVQEQTDSKIRTLLNPEQQKKFDAFLAKQKQARKAKPRKAS